MKPGESYREYSKRLGMATRDQLREIAVADTKKVEKKKEYEFTYLSCELNDSKDYWFLFFLVSCQNSLCFLVFLIALWHGILTVKIRFLKQRKLKKKLKKRQRDENSDDDNGFNPRYGNPPSVEDNNSDSGVEEPNEKKTYASEVLTPADVGGFDPRMVAMKPKPIPKAPPAFGEVAQQPPDLRHVVPKPMKRAFSTTPRS
jgi:hypothetical protein